MKSLIVLLLIPIFLPLSAISRSMIIDFHVHPLSPDNFGSDAVTGAAILEQMERAGVARSVLLSVAYFFDDAEKARIENDFVAQEAARSAGRLVPFCGVNARAPWALAELARCHDVLGMRGLKLHLVKNRVTAKDPAQRKQLEAIFSLAEKYGYPVVVHNRNWDTDDTIELALLMMKHPGARFVFAHALTMNYRDLYHLVEIYEVNPGIPRNIFVDVSDSVNIFAGSPEQDAFVWYLGKFGFDHVLWGSDFAGIVDQNSLTPLGSLRALRKLQLGPTQLRQILNTNAMQLLSHRDPTKSS